jgi:hypothetical protein
MFDRPAKLSDKLPSPYANEQQARKINNGALPPDLSLIVKSRKHGEDYIFSLLTGYKEPPAGVQMAPLQYYNPYFPGGKIGMDVQLRDGGVEYPDGTPATASQVPLHEPHPVPASSTHPHPWVCECCGALGVASLLPYPGPPTLWPHLPLADGQGRCLLPGLGCGA